MKELKVRKGKGSAGVLLAALMIFAISGCATTGGVGGSSAAALAQQHVDRVALGSRTYNTLRFVTYGPYPQQLYGYFLYGDGVEVSVSGRITGTPVGKMTLAQVQADYQRILRENMTTGGELFLRQILRSGQVVGFTATMPMLNPTVWDTAPGSAGAILQVTFP